MVEGEADVSLYNSRSVVRSRRRRRRCCCLCGTLPSRLCPRRHCKRIRRLTKDICRGLESLARRSMPGVALATQLPTVVSLDVRR